MIAQSYPSLEAFYGADARCRDSRERDLRRALRGFREACGRAGSLVWFLERASGPVRAAA